MRKGENINKPTLLVIYLVCFLTVRCREILTLEGLLTTIVHDPVAYSRAKDILESKREINEVLEGVVFKEEEELEEESEED